jgi:hypothetical protein
MLEDEKNGRKESGIKMSELKLCPFCNGKVEITNPYGNFYQIGCYTCGFSSAVQIDLIQKWNNRPIEDALRTSRAEWKADATRLAELVEAQRNAYDLMGYDGIKSITEKGYKKLECAFNAHTMLVEKDKEGKWNELAKHVLDENRGAWEELGKEEKK